MFDGLFESLWYPEVESGLRDIKIHEVQSRSNGFDRFGCTNVKGESAILCLGAYFKWGELIWYQRGYWKQKVRNNLHLNKSLISFVWWQINRSVFNIPYNIHTVKLGNTADCCHTSEKMRRLDPVL